MNKIKLNDIEHTYETGKNRFGENVRWVKIQKNVLENAGIRPNVMCRAIYYLRFTDGKEFECYSHGSFYNFQEGSTSGNFGRLYKFGSYWEENFLIILD